MKQKKFNKETTKKLLELEGIKKGDPDYNYFKLMLDNLLKSRIKKTWKYFFDDCIMWIVILLSIIFRPLNILIAGAIYIIILLI